MKEDIKIKCQDCGTEFVFNVAEQNFYEEKGFVQPKRCRLCRQNRKMKGDKNYGNEKKDN